MPDKPQNWLSRLWGITIPWHAVPCLMWFAVWVCLFMAGMQERAVFRVFSEPDKSWPVCVGYSLLLIPLIYFAYLWGKTDGRNVQAVAHSDE